MHLITWKRVCGISSILCGRVSLLLLPRDHLGLTSKHNALCCCSSGFSLHSHSGEASRPLRVSSCDRYFCFSRSACSCRGCVCRSCWLPYNIKECECRSCPILHTRMVPPTHFVHLHHTFLIMHVSFCLAFSLSYSFCSPCSPLLLWFLPRWLFCWQAPAGCHGSERGGILSV